MTESEITKPSRKTRGEQAPRQRETIGGWRGWPGRIARCLMGGALFGGAAAAIDGWWAHGGVEPGDGAAGFGSILLNDWGVNAPALLLVAVSFAVLALLASPGEAPSARPVWAWLHGEPNQAQLHRALLLPFSIVGAGIWVIITAHASRALMSTIAEPRAAGLAIAAMSTLSAVFAVGLSLTFFVAARAALTHRRRKVRARFHAWWTGGAAIALCMILAAWGISTGSTGGEGGLLGFLGVFKRLELDLRAPMLALIVGLGAFTMANPLRRVWAPLAFVLGLAPVLLSVRAATALDDAPKVSAALERSAPLARTSLRVLRRLTDRDRDGAAAYFGGGDCDDANPEVNPLGIDIAGNGIDEDCSGGDRTPVAKTTPNAPASASAPAAASASAAPTAGSAIADDLNVILITVDTLRWDVGFMGYPRPITPALDALAKRSVVFEHNYAMSSYTGKAIGPLIAGKYPSETHMGWKHYNVYPETDIMVQERLQTAGIHTLAIHCHWYFKKDTGLGRGFDLFDLSALPSQGIDATTDTTYSADRLTDAAIKVLSDGANTSKRFYAWIHYFDPHAEYMRHPGTETFGRGVRDMYDHEVRWTDDQMSRLLDFIAAQAWGKKTAIIVTSDHGEAFGEHKMYRHGFEVWEEIVRVPLVVYVPGVTAKRVKERRSEVDLVPTIMDLMKVKPGEPKGDFDFVSGLSLVPDMLAPDDAKLPQRPILVDMPPGPFNEARRAFIDGDMKLIVAGGVRYQLFDLAKDPGETKDLADDKELMRKVREKYDAFREGLREVPIRRPPK